MLRGTETIGLNIRQLAMHQRHDFGSRTRAIAQRSLRHRGASVGFSLIELMVAVAIAGILAAIAYPSYLSQMKKSRRSSAESALMDIAQREQQYLLDARAYAPDLGTLNGSNPNNASAFIPSEVSPFYTIQICQSATSPCAAPGGSPPAFAIIATPIAGTAQAGDYTLTIDNTGAKTPSSVW